MTEPPERTRESSNPLTSKLGPLPAWGWIAIAAAGGVVLLLWLQNRKASQVAAQPSTVDTQGPDAAAVSNLQDEMATVLAQLRDLQSKPGVPGPTGPPGPPGKPPIRPPIDRPPLPPPVTSPRTVTIPAGSYLYPWVANMGISLEKLYELNPFLIKPTSTSPTGQVLFKAPGPGLPPGAIPQGANFAPWVPDAQTVRVS